MAMLGAASVAMKLDKQCGERADAPSKLTLMMASLIMSYARVS